MKKMIACSLMVMGMAFSAKAQSTKRTEKTNQWWVGYFNQLRFGDK